MPQSIRFHHFIFLGMCILICGCLQAYAGDVSLAWDPSASENVVGYKVYYGNASRSYDSFQTVTNQTSCTVTDLSDGTYYFAVTAFDSAGNESGYSNEVSANVGDGTPPTDGTPPVISAVASSGITATGATISWTTNEASTTQVEYGTTTAYGSTTTLNTSLQTSHTQALSGLTGGTVYHYRVRSADAAANLAVSGDRTFTTSTQSDTTPPVISSVASSNITTFGATISWTTNEASTTQVEYGTTTAYGSTTTLNTSLQVSHAQALSGLSIGTLYHYRVKSGDAAGNMAASGDFTFMTTPDTTPPTIGSIVISGQTGTEATVTWITNEAADSQIEYGTTTAYGGMTTLETSLKTVHAQVITGLTMGDLYHIRVLSSDEAGNLAVSEDRTFTAAPPAATLTLPLFDSGQIAGNDALYVGMALTNMDAGPATIILTAFDVQGDRIVGEGIANPAVRQVSPGAQLSLVDVQIFGDSLSQFQSGGWMRIESTTVRVRGFFLTFDGQTRLMDGVGFASDPLSHFVFTDIEANGRNQINLINNNPENASVTIDLVRSNGQLRNSVTDTIEGYGSMTANIYTELFHGITPDSTDYIRVSASQGIEPFLLMQQRNADISFITAQDMNEGASALYSPQYMFDRTYRTSLSIVNLDSTEGNVRLRLYGEDGVQIGETEEMPIAPNGKLFIDDPEFFLTPAIIEEQIEDVLRNGANRIAGALFGESDRGDSTTVISGTDGYVRIESSGIRLIGSMMLRDRKRETFASALPLVSDLHQSLVFSHVASDDLYFTGIALVNPGGSNATVTLELYTSEGTYVSDATLSIPAGRRKCSLLTDIFPSLRSVNLTSGYIRLSSDTPVAAYSIFGTRNLSILSAIPGQVDE
jgi:hypothetical protein